MPQAIINSYMFSAAVPSPPQSDLWLWLDASQETYTDGQDGVQFTDFSANANPFVPLAGGSTTPIFKTAEGPDGTPTFFFAAGGKGFVSTIASTTPGFTEGEIFFVIKQDSAIGTGANGFTRLGSSAEVDFYQFAGDLFSNALSTVRKSFTPAFTRTDWQYLDVSSKAAEWIFRAGGATEFSTGTNSFGVRGDLAGTSIGYSPGGPTAFRGWIAEVLWYGVVLDAATRTAVESYLTTKYPSL